MTQGAAVATARIYQRKGLYIQLPLALVALAVMAWIWVRWMPMPAAALTITTGRAEGVYHGYAQLYAQRFASYGVQLRVLESEGSQQNLDRLLDRADTEAGTVQLAFMQGGVGYPPGQGSGARVRTLANVDIEPLWIFSRHAGLDSLQELQGLRVSLGPAGSGTRRVALHLLDLFRVKPGDFTDSDMAGMATVQALKDGTLDVVMMVSAPESAVINAMLLTPGVHLVQLRRSAAILDRLPYLQARLLPQGALDPGGRAPPADVTMLTTLASLVARSDLDPALKRLATQVAIEVQSRAGQFHRAGEFPSLRRADYPVSAHARDVLANGLYWHERALPFWWAQVLTRLVLVCLPVALLALWLGKLLPAYLRWVLESRITRWYGELKYIENDLRTDSVSGLGLSKYNERLARIDARLLGMHTPAELRQRWFTLRQHVDFVRMDIVRRRGR